jgi:hypothetical protein
MRMAIVVTTIIVLLIRDYALATWVTSSFHISQNKRIIDMSGAELAKFLNKSIVILDQRTNRTYTAKIMDATHQYGKLRLKVSEKGSWFEPTATELKNVF